jgi:hypothetical protein
MLLFIPAESMQYGELTDIFGLLLGGVLYAYEFMAVRRLRRQAA